MSPNSHSSLTPQHALCHWFRELPSENTGDGRQKSSREEVAPTSLLDVNFLGITLLWLCFPEHTRLVQMPSELQGRQAHARCVMEQAAPCAQHHLEAQAGGRPLSFLSFCEFIFQTRVSVPGCLYLFDFCRKTQPSDTAVPSSRYE